MITPLFSIYLAINKHKDSMRLKRHIYTHSTLLFVLFDMSMVDKVRTNGFSRLNEIFPFQKPRGTPGEPLGHPLGTAEHPLLLSQKLLQRLASRLFDWVQPWGKRRHNVMTLGSWSRDAASSKDDVPLWRCGKSVSKHNDTCCPQQEVFSGSLDTLLKLLRT